MAVSQKALFEYYNGESILSETKNLVFKASNYFQNTNNCLKKLNDQISAFNNAGLKAEIIYDDEQNLDNENFDKNNKSFYYKPTNESITIIDNFKENIGNILKEYYHNYFFLKEYFKNFEINYSNLNKITSYAFEKTVAEKSKILKPLYLFIKNFKNDFQNAKRTELLSDLESLIKNVPQKENCEFLQGENDLIENMNMTIYQILNAVKTYDSKRISSKLNELIEQYNELVLPLRETFNEINSFEDKMFTVRANFIKLIEECEKNTEDVVKLVNNLDHNLYEKGFSSDFPCHSCDKYAINEPIAFSMNRKQLNEYLIRLKKDIKDKFSGDINSTSINEFRTYIENCFDSLRNDPINFVPDSKNFITSIKGDVIKKFLLSYEDAPLEIKFTKKEFERFRDNVAKEVALKIEKEINDNLQASMAKKDGKYSEVINYLIEKTGSLKRSVRNNRSLEFLIEDKKDLDKQIEKDLNNIEDSKESYIYFEEKKDERFSVLRKDLHQLPEEIENFEAEMVPSKTKISSVFDEMLVKQRKKDANNLANKLNTYKGIPWLKDLGEEAFINEQLVLDGLRYTLSQKKNLLYRFFDYAGNKIKDCFYELGDLLADKLNIPKKTLPALEFEASDVLAFKNREPKTHEEFSQVYNKAREEYYLRKLKKRGASSPGDKIVSSVAIKHNVNKAYEIKYLLNDRITEPAKKFLKEKVGEPTKEFFADKVIEPAKKFIVNKWNALKTRLENEESDKLALMENIESFIADNITNPWHKRMPQLDSNTYDSLKNNENRKSGTEQLHSQLAINSKPKYRKNLADIAVDAIDKFKESKKKLPKIIDASSQDPTILARMNDDYCRPCFETLDKSKVTLNPKKLILDEINKVFVKNNVQGFLEKPFIPMLVPEINEENELVLTKKYNKVYYCKGTYEPEEGYGFYEFLKI